MPVKYCLVFLVLLFAGYSSAASITPTPRIIGGEAVSSTSFYPFMATVYGSSRGNVQLCGGTLIAPQWVLTAGHCLFDSGSQYAPGNMTVFISGTQRKAVNDGGSFNVDRIIVHANYNNSQTDSKDDIALLHLSRSADSKSLNLGGPKQLGYLTQQTNKINLLRAIGWGTTDNSSPQSPSQTLQFVDLDYLPITTCQNKRDNVDNSQICAVGINRSKDTCRGDSGGPLMLQQGGAIYLMGITSYGVNPCGSKGEPAVYTSVPAHLNWIVDNIHNAGKQPSLALLSSASQSATTTSPIGDSSRISTTISNHSGHQSAHHIGFSVTAADLIAITTTRSSSRGLLDDLFGSPSSPSTPPAPSTPPTAPNNNADPMPSTEVSLNDFTCSSPGRVVTCRSDLTLAPQQSFDLSIPVSYQGRVNQPTQLGLQVMPLADEYNAYGNLDLVTSYFVNRLSFETQVLTDNRITNNAYEGTLAGRIRVTNRTSQRLSAVQVAVESIPGVNITLNNNGCQPQCDSGSIAANSSFTLAFKGDISRLTDGLSIQLTDRDHPSELRLNSILLATQLLSPQSKQPINNQPTAPATNQPSDSSNNADATTASNSSGGGGGGGGSSGPLLMLLIGLAFGRRFISSAK